MFDPNVLVGSSNADDAGVYRISDDLAMVLTADFFTPIVDDPYWFGAIAAANALSDVYAMGGKAMAALNLAALPGSEDFREINKRIILGGFEKMKEAGVPVIGGHTIKDKEPKFGYAVMGSVHPDKILDNTKARPGDALVLTKKIGTGIVATGIKAGRCSAQTAEEFMQSMAALNKRASEIMLEVGISTATDITGFGLIGHLNEVLTASRLTARMHGKAVPVFAEAVSMAEMGMVPGGTRANQKNYDPFVEWVKDVSATDRILLNDAQTSGGLLIFVPAARKDRLIADLQKANITAAHVGDVQGNGEKAAKRIFVEP
ncbi:MAG: selenide, water dikinase SelD [Nitrospirae bacterium GWD2_57_9]|nr:MAG: selenide, water dikinase SelD [Nitrospirae bacterium GWD2_57_9]OGW48273.1 MAG: selenide, water dikinase SelD [Nitrospirae bacterium GWC2_57_9]